MIGPGRVVAVHRSPTHHFSKEEAGSIRLLAGLGVDGDAHCGETVRHRSRWSPTTTVPNLRQVHLIAAELFDELGGQGFAVAPGELGENVTTTGLDLASLPTGTRLRLGADAVVELTGLRTPCVQIDRFREGLRAAVTTPAADGRPSLRSGVMAVVVAGGEVAPDDVVEVELPAEPHEPLVRV